MREDIKSIFPDVLIIFSFSTITVVIINIGTLAFQLSTTNYQLKIDVVVLTVLTVLPICILIGFIGLIWKIRRLNQKVASQQ